MYRIFKKIAMVTASLLLLVSLGVVTNNAHVNAKRHYHVHSYRTYKSHAKWRSGMPRPLRKSAQWVSNYEYNSRRKSVRYIRYVSPLSAHSGFVFNVTMYNNHFRPTRGGAGSAYANVNPHYQILGHGWYRIASGSLSKHHSLYEETHGMPRMKMSSGYTELVHMHGKRHFTIWSYELLHKGQPYYKSKLNRLGYFTRYKRIPKKIWHTLK